MAKKKAVKKKAIKKAMPPQSNMSGSQQFSPAMMTAIKNSPKGKVPPSLAKGKKKVAKKKSKVKK